MIVNKKNEEIIKFILMSKDINTYEKYENELNLNYFKKLNKYFKMFDNINELENDLIAINKENNIEIANVSNNEIILQLRVLARNDNIVKLN